MQTVQSGYDPYTSVRWVNMRVVFSLIDLQAASLAVPSTSGAAFISQLSQLTDSSSELYGKFPALETDFWTLDGTMNILPDVFTGLQTGWYSSEISGADGFFTTPPTLTFTFSDDISSIGFTLNFDATHGQWPVKFQVAVYDAVGSLVSSAAVGNSESMCAIYLPSYAYRRVVFTFLQTSEPNRRVRVSECLFGIIQRFNKDSLTKATLSYGVDAKAASLPSRELEFTFDNSDHKYNLINPDGIYAYLQEGQPIDAEIQLGSSRGSGEWVGMGRFYFSSAEAKDETLTASITASDKVLWLDGSTCRIGASGGWTLAVAVAAVLSDAGTDIETDIPSELAGRTVGKQIPEDASHREALRLLAQAARCTCWIDRDGALVFRALTLGTVRDAFSASNMTSLAGIAVTERVNTVAVSVQDSYVEGSQAVVYTASNKEGDESVRAVSVTNPCAYDGQALADWLLTAYQRRLAYTPSYRGNPALEIGDTVTVASAYGDVGSCVITGSSLIYDGGLSGTINGQGGVWT